MLVLFAMYTFSIAMVGTWGERRRRRRRPRAAQRRLARGWRGQCGRWRRHGVLIAGRRASARSILLKAFASAGETPFISKTTRSSSVEGGSERQRQSHHSLLTAAKASPGCQRVRAHDAVAFRRVCRHGEAGCGGAAAVLRGSPPASWDPPISQIWMLKCALKSSKLNELSTPDAAYAFA